MDNEQSNADHLISGKALKLRSCCLIALLYLNFARLTLLFVSIEGRCNNDLS